jgi:hypothetical protein
VATSPAAPYRPPGAYRPPGNYLLISMPPILILFHILGVFFIYLLYFKLIGASGGSSALSDLLRRDKAPVGKVSNVVKKSPTGSGIAGNSNNKQEKPKKEKKKEIIVEKVIVPVVEVVVSL